MEHSYSMKTFLICVMTVFFAACSSVPVTPDGCMGAVNQKAVLIDAGKTGTGSLATAHIGSSGFYYLLSAEGKVLVHPNSGLVGRDFSRSPQVKAILAKDRGIQNDGSGESSRVVFFRRLSSGDILCLTVDAAELSAPPD